MPTVAPLFAPRSTRTPPECRRHAWRHLRRFAQAARDAARFMPLAATRLRRYLSPIRCAPRHASGAAARLRYYAERLLPRHAGAFYERHAAIALKLRAAPCCCRRRADAAAPHAEFAAARCPLPRLSLRFWRAAHRLRPPDFAICRPAPSVHAPPPCTLASVLATRWRRRSIRLRRCRLMMMPIYCRQIETRYAAPTRSRPPRRSAPAHQRPARCRHILRSSMLIWPIACPPPSLALRRVAAALLSPPPPPDFAFPPFRR